MDYLENELNVEAMPDSGESPENPGEIKIADVFEPVDEADFPQADSEEEASKDAREKPKRRSHKKKEDLPDVPGGSLISEPDAPDSDGSGEEEKDALPEEAESGDVEQSTPGRRSAACRPVILDSSGNVIYDRADSGQHDLSVLTAAHNARRILTATVDAIETDGEALPRVVFYMGTVKVMIPFSQMGFDLDPETVTPREARLLIDSMLGAKIDYMVRGVDTEARVAAGSRRDAMLMRQRTILNARSTSDPDEYRINEGMRVMARIVHVSRMMVRVEVYGFESYVRIDSISNLWVSDVREVVQVGEERPVEVVSLQRDE